MHVAAGQTLTVGWNSVAVGKTIRGRTEHPVLHLESPPGTVFRLGRQVLKATVAGAATLTGAGCEFTRSSPAGQLFAIQLDGATLECEISARQGLVPGAWTWALARLRLDETQRQSLQADAWQFTQALAPDAPPTHAAFCASRIVASVAKAMVAQDAARPAGALSQQRLRSLEAWIDAHLDSPISLGKLCAQAGVGERCHRAAAACIAAAPRCGRAGAERHARGTGSGLRSPGALRRPIPGAVRGVALADAAPATRSFVLWIVAPPSCHFNSGFAGATQAVAVLTMPQCFKTSRE